jgi:hypothetical protein
MTEEGYPDRVHEQSKYEMNRLEMEMAAARTTPKIRQDIDLIEDGLKSYQSKDEPEIMDYEESRPTIITSLTPKTIL